MGVTHLQSYTYSSRLEEEEEEEEESPGKSGWRGGYTLWGLGK